MAFHIKGEHGRPLWDGFVEGLEDGSINLSLYLNKYVDIYALEEPTKAKGQAVGLLSLPGQDLRTLKDTLINALSEIKKIFQQNGFPGTVQKVETAIKMVELGNLYDVCRSLPELQNVRLRNYHFVKSEFQEAISKLNTSTNTLKIPSKALTLYASYFELYRNLVGSGTTFRMRTGTRLVVGLGSAGVYETSITLHRNYGVPYIPGSAMKGVTRAYAIEMLADTYYGQLGENLFEKLKDITKKLEKAAEKNGMKFERNIYGAMAVMDALLSESDEKRIPGDVFDWNINVNGVDVTVRELREIFGTVGSEGSVVFFDALPNPESLKGEVLEFDIMNPHYPDYYRGNDAPGDWQNPNPIKFLVVREGIDFLFAVGRSKTCKDPNLVEKAEKLLKLALKDHGVGAKTSLGYGRLKEVP